jgi:hypothetical protein
MRKRKEMQTGGPQDIALLVCNKMRDNHQRYDGKPGEHVIDHK